MHCPNCAAAMTPMTLAGHLGPPVISESCTDCQAFWFDLHESLRLEPASVLKLAKFIEEHSGNAKPWRKDIRCPHCEKLLSFTHDLQGNTHFAYWRCVDHGRLIGFVDFMREKSFIHVPTAEEIAEIKLKVQMVNCPNCGAPADLQTSSVCAYCGTPISLVDIKKGSSG